MLFPMETYEQIRSRRKTLALEITPDCRVLVRAPMGLSQDRIDAFVAGHQAWIIWSVSTSAALLCRPRQRRRRPPL